MSLTTTPSANRLHIGIFGKRNSGKSSLINAITNQDTALTSEVAGTTTDPVYKAMEIHGIGPCMLIDTAGFDDEGELGALRVRRTRDALEKTDVAIVVFCEADVSLEADWIGALQERGTPVVAVTTRPICSATSPRSPGRSMTRSPSSPSSSPQRSAPASRT